MSDIVIRLATDVDWPAIWNILHAVIKPGDTYALLPDSTESHAKAYWFDGDKRVYVAEKQGKIVGSYVLKDNQPGLGSHVANGAFIVCPNSRGQSVGTLMGRDAIITARSLGYLAMQFNFVISTNERAVALWKKLGFSIIGTIPEGYWYQNAGKFVDAYIMYRKL